MFNSVLIANRGEIACRIAGTAKRLGMRCIAVYSDADAHARHVRLCDEAYRIGPAPATESYLAIDTVIDIAKRRGAQCIHPGYGFLAENAMFAEACAAAGIVFVGSPPEAIRAMGLKDRAKTLMHEAGVPIVAGYHGERQELKFLKEKAYEIGYPILIKPVAGGGGKGMRKVERHLDFDAALEAARREAASAFGHERVLLERFVTAPRHIEIQIFSDSQGHVVHLNERDCSLQRRHQKVIEEAPAPGMTPELRDATGRAAIEAARAVGYVGAGTVEFIADGSGPLRADGFWFLEMNTRLQVEHPVTEATTGLDLVEWQFRVAAGEPLPLAQQDVRISGHAIEARIYAEDPGQGFLPSTGRLLAWAPPQGDGIRVDSGVDADDAVVPFYDPMIAKVIAHAATREAALAILSQALDKTIAAGPCTNLGFLAALCAAPEFRHGGVDTGFIDRHLAALTAATYGIDYSAAARGVARLIEGRMAALRHADEDGATEPASPWDATDGFQLSGERRVLMRVTVDGEAITATVSHTDGGFTVAVADVLPASDAHVVEAADAVYVLRHGRQTVVRTDDISETVAAGGDSDGIIRAPMHGKVLALLVVPAATVHKGQRIAVIEAMKMEHALTAPIDGVVGEIVVRIGDQVAEGGVIARIDPVAESE